MRRPYPWLAPLNVNLLTKYGPGDFPPISRDVQRSASPLVSAELQHFRGPLPFPERPMLASVVVFPLPVGPVINTSPDPRCSIR